MALTPGLKCVAFCFAKNLRDLSETALAIVKNIDEAKRGDLPSEAVLDICIRVLTSSYPEKLFTPEGFVYNAEVVNKYPYSIVFDIYTGVREEITDAICKAVHERDEKYFCENFDSVFHTLISQPAIGKYVGNFKNFLINPHIKQEDKEYVWDFFTEMLNLVRDGDEYAKKIVKG